ncbi:MAG TPA: hypothetical protein VGC15_00675 [Acetobacteraceae bacterium]
MDDPNLPARQAPQWLLDVLGESRADVAAGRTSPWPDVRARLMKLIEDGDSGADQTEPEQNGAEQHRE